MSQVDRVPTSTVPFGHARVDITPPVGIYHRTWGAAKHDRATGVHRPLFTDVICLARLGESEPFCLRAHTDLVGLVREQQEMMFQALSEGSSVPVERIVVAHCHTHSSGWFPPDRLGLPGGELIPGYLEELAGLLREAARQAVASLQPATITYGTGRCSMARNRDFPVEGGYVCGFNPDLPAEDRVIVARVTDEAGKARATFLHYGCHPTTLAWDNSLISPDYIGAAREVVERETGVPCVFMQGACGDLGPRTGFVGDTEVADKNGRELGFAALSTLTALDPPATDFTYQGAVISGATIGTWASEPQDEARAADTSRLAVWSGAIDQPLKPRPDPDALAAERDKYEAKRFEYEASGDTIAARDAWARAERARRWLGRLRDLPPGDTAPQHFSVWLVGEALWIATGGEPYSALIQDLRARFPDRPVILTPLAGNLQVAYLLEEQKYGIGLYQDECSILAPGCLERLRAAMIERAAALLAGQE